MNSNTGEPFDEGGGGGADLSAGGTLPVGGPTNTNDAAFAYEVSGGDIWTSGIDASDAPAGDRPYKIARGGVLGTNDVLELAETGELTLNAYIPGGALGHVLGNHLTIGAGGVISSAAAAGGGGDVLMTTTGTVDNGIVRYDGSGGPKTIQALYASATPTISDAGQLTMPFYTGVGDVLAVNTGGQIIASTLAFGDVAQAVASTTDNQIALSDTGVGTKNIQTVYAVGKECSINPVTGDQVVGGKFRFENTTTIPATGLKGQVFFDTNDDVLKVWDGANWLNIQAFSGTPTLVVNGSPQNLVVGQRSVAYTTTVALFQPGALTYAWTSTDTGAFFSDVTGASTFVEFSAVGNFTVSCTATHVNTTSAVGVSNPNTITAAPTVEGVLDVGLTSVTSGTYVQGNYGALLSTRRLRAAYTGSCMRVIRTVGGTLTNVGFDSDGYVSRTQIESAPGTGDITVETWYDQSGNAFNATNMTLITRPRVIVTGTVPRLSFAGGTSRFLTVGGTITQLKLDQTTQEHTFITKNDGTAFVAATGVMGTNGTWEYRTFDVTQGAFVTGGTSIEYTNQTAINLLVSANHISSSVGMETSPANERFSTSGTTYSDLGNKVDKLPTTTGVGAPGLRIGTFGITATPANNWLGDINEVLMAGIVMSPGDRNVLGNRAASHFDARGNYPDIQTGTLTALAPVATGTAWCSSGTVGPVVNEIEIEQVANTVFTSTAFDFFFYTGSINDNVAGTLDAGAVTTQVFNGASNIYNGDLGTTTSYIPPGGGAPVNIVGPFIEFEIPSGAVGGYDIFLRTTVTSRDPTNFVVLFTSTVEANPLLDNRTWEAPHASCVQPSPSLPGTGGGSRSFRADFGSNFGTNFVRIRLVIHGMASSGLCQILELDALRYI